MATETGSRLLEQAQAFRDALERQNEGAVSRMTRSWGTALERIDLEIQGLMSKMEAARLAGIEPSPAWLYQERRLSALVDQVGDELARWAPLADETVRQNAYQAAANAQRQARDLTREAAREALPGLEASFTDLSPENMATVLGHLAPGGPLRDLFASVALETIQAAEDALLQGVILGKGSDWITRQLHQALDVPRWRAETIARTEALRAYRETSRLTYQRSNVVGSWVWTAALDRRTCPACLALHGEEFSLDEQLDGHPRCRCAMVPRTKTWAELGLDPTLDDLPDTRPPIQTGADWLAAQGPATQRAILGPTRYKLWSDGQITLPEMVARTHSPEWGTMRRERSLIEIREGRNANYRDTPAAPTNPYDGLTDEQVKALINQGDTGAMREMSRRLRANPPEPDAAKWARWETGRDRRVFTGDPAEVRRRTDDVDRARRYAEEDAAQLADAQALLKERQAELRRLIPDAKERARHSRVDGTLLGRKENVRYLKERAEQSAARLAEAEQKLNAVKGTDLPDFNPDNPLEFYGDRITIEARSTSSQRWLTDLETYVDQDHHTMIRNHFAEAEDGGFYLGDGAIPGLDDLSHLGGQAPRGWPDGSTFDNVTGVYDPRRRVCACGHDDHGASSYHSTVLHESGHVLDQAYGRPGVMTGHHIPASSSREYVAAYDAVPESVRRTWNPYYRKDGNPNGYTSEAWAEGFMGWTKAHRGTEMDQAESVARALLGRRPTPEETRAHLGLARYYASLRRP